MTSVRINEFSNWHFEVEYLYKTYAHDAFKDVHAFNGFVNYDLPIKKGLFKKISFLGRYDSMGDHSNGVANEEGQLYITDYSRSTSDRWRDAEFRKSFSGRFAYQLREIFL